MGRLNLPSDGGHTSRSSRNVSCYPSEHPSSKSLFQHYKDDDPSEGEICTTTYRPSRNSGITDPRMKRERQHEVNVFELEQLLKSKIHRNYSPYSGIGDTFVSLKLANRQESDEASSFTDTVSTKISSNNNNTQDQSSLVLRTISTGDAQAPQSTEDTMSDISELTNVESIQRGESLVEINQVVLGNSSQHTGSSASTLFTEEESQAYEYRRVRFAEGTVYVTGKTIGKPLGTVNSKGRARQSIVKMGKNAIRSILPK